MGLRSYEILNVLPQITILIRVPSIQLGDHLEYSTRPGILSNERKRCIGGKEHLYVAISWEKRE